LSVANQLSATALSQYCRGRERLWRIAWPASSVVKLRAVYCEPLKLTHYLTLSSNVSR